MITEHDKLGAPYQRFCGVCSGRINRAQVNHSLNNLKFKLNIWKGWSESNRIKTQNFTRKSLFKSFFMEYSIKLESVNIYTINQVFEMINREKIAQIFLICD